MANQDNMEKSVKSVKIVPNPEREGFLGFFKFWKPKQIAIEETKTGKKE